MERLELILPVIPPQMSAIKVSCLCASTPEGIYTEHVPICCASTRLDLSFVQSFCFLQFRGRNIEIALKVEIKL